jgi:ATP-dependent Lon protease
MVSRREGTLWSHLETYEIGTRCQAQLFVNKVLGAFEQYAKLSQHLAFEGLLPTLKLDEPDRLTDTLASHLTVPTAEKQAMLELLSPYERLQRLLDLLDVEMEKMNLDRRINVQVKKQMEKAQKEYYLNEKIKAIHQELGKKDDGGRDRGSTKIESGAPEAVAERPSRS